ncbi:PQQ-dependent sugar dehydrogenase [Portibacter marinus]|uniref:PQQ-dependent sugar dehydrogenase n=1 Tax=Portibacter marinus TaxID=2898660 RepID=UPI001F40B318|nr:sorbosone dehydrogenase family protein [Portibacter marinus]
MTKLLISILFSSGILLACFSKINPPSKVFGPDYEGNLPLDTLQLPEGFKIDVYAEGVTNARSMAYSPDGTLYVSTRNEGNVYALKDTDGDYKVDSKTTILEDLTLPNGVALRNGDLYIAEVNRILRVKDIANNIKEGVDFEVINEEYPDKKHHGWKYIAFGPDDKLYVPVGAPCNICESEEDIFNTITRMDPDGSNMEIVHSGIRNTVGFDWHPVTGDLYFTDNGRDWMGDDQPECELNRATEAGMHFGYPYCHQGNLLDPKLGEGKSCDDYIAPVLKLGPHTAPLGIEFYTGEMFPSEYKNQAFIARHGSWNREKKIGYDVILVEFDANNNAVRYTPFITGWLNNENDKVWGRPVDIEQLPDGSILISDDYADAIYRVYYEG